MLYARARDMIATVTGFIPRAIAGFFIFNLPESIAKACCHA
jgi:hypothetical protein